MRLWAHHHLTSFGAAPTTVMVNSGGSVRYATRRITGVMMSVEMMSWSFRAGSISSPRFTLQTLVAKKVVMRHTKIPAALTKRGNSMAMRL